MISIHEQNKLLFAFFGRMAAEKAHLVESAASGCHVESVDIPECGRFLACSRFPGNPVHMKKTPALIAMMDGYMLGDDMKPHTGPDDLPALDALIPRLSHINGSFRGIFFNREKRRGYVLNDRHASRALFYIILEDGLAVSSSLFFLLSLFPERAAISRSNLLQYFSIGQFLGGDTFFPDVHFLESGKYLMFEGGKTKIGQFWNYSMQEAPRQERQVVMEKVYHTLHDHVQAVVRGRRMGYSLSGGSDSRFAVILGAGSPAIAFTFGETRRQSPNAEVRIARSVAGSLDIPHHHIRLGPGQFINGVSRLIDETGGMDPISAWYIPVMYDFVKDLQVDSVMEGTALDLTLGGSYLGYHENVPLSRQIAGFKKWTLFGEDILEKMMDFPNLEPLMNRIESELKTIEQPDPERRLDLFLFKNRVSRMTRMGSIPMYNRLPEVTPFIHADVIDLLYSIPLDWKRNHRFYRDMLIRYCPRHTLMIPELTTMIPLLSPLWLHKIFQAGFYISRQAGNMVTRWTRRNLWMADHRTPLPLDYWILRSSDSGEWIRSLFNDNNAHIYHFLNRTYCQKLWKNYLEGRLLNLSKINQIVTFELFLRRLRDITGKS